MKRRGQAVEVVAHSAMVQRAILLLMAGVLSRPKPPELSRGRGLDEYRVEQAMSEALEENVGSLAERYNQAIAVPPFPPLRECQRRFCMRVPEGEGRTLGGAAGCQRRAEDSLVGGRRLA